MLSLSFPRTGSMIKERPEKAWFSGAEEAGQGRLEHVAFPSANCVCLSGVWDGEAMIVQGVECAHPFSNSSPSTPVLAVPRGSLQRSILSPGRWSPKELG